MITFSFENGVTATIRTSGTEPKIKYYAEIASKPEDRFVIMLICTTSSFGIRFREFNAVIKSLYLLSTYSRCSSYSIVFITILVFSLQPKLLTYLCLLVSRLIQLGSHWIVWLIPW